MKTALHLAGVASMIAAGSSPAAAQELIVAAGYTQFSNNFSIDSPQVSLEYLHSPFYDAGRFEVALAAIALAHSSGDVFLGGGLSARYTFHPRWFIDVSVMPGAY